MLSELKKEFDGLRRWLEGKEGERRVVKKRLDDTVKKLDEATEMVGLHNLECETLKVASDLLRETIRERVENLATSALRSVFDRRDYRLELDMKLKYGQMTATPMLVSEFRGAEIRQPVLEAHGGGLVNVVSFVLQVVVLALTRPNLRRIMLLDEAFKNVRDEIGNVATLLRKLHEITGIQFVVITKEQALCDAADIVYDVTKASDGATKFDRRGGE